ncbi:MAG: hypothetical protein H6719_00855 [Sandaracinaceae bacterium]|nr:hypothetical protein [Sandaracinaceae bacterium]
MRTIRSIAVAGLAMVTATSLSGCYLFHSDPEFDGSIPPGFDGGTPLPFDAGPDATVLMDAGVPGIDAGEDGGLDAATPGADAEPPLERPPNPEGCRIEPPPFRGPVLETRWPDDPAMIHGSSVHVCSTPVAVDPDPSDGLGDTVVGFISYATLRGEERGILRIWNPRTHETISYPPDEAELGVMEATGNIAAGDLDGDGDIEFVGMGVYSGTYAIHHDGTLLWESPFPTVRDRGERWERTIGTAISLVDLEGDGIVEVLAGRNVLDGRTGDRRFVGDSATTTRGTNEFLGPISCAADLDGDGVQEVIAGRTAFRADGTVFWNQTSVGDGLCAVADLIPTNPGPEVALSSQGYLYVLSGQNGDILYNRVIEGRGRTGVGGAPTIADFDGDMRPEIGIAHGAAYGVYDLDCERRGRPAGCIAEGLLWTAETGDDSSSGTGSSVFDFNGDGRAEVVYNDQYFFRIYDGTNGRVLFEQRNSSRTRTENPIIVDVDNDGEAEVIFSANAEAFFIRDFWTDPGVEIWGDRRGRWVGSRRIWNQHTYHITNVNEDGSIASPEPMWWTTQNSYRQNLREGADVLVVADLWGGRGRYMCLGDGRIRIEVDVGNYGLERVGAGVVVGFYRGPPSAGVRVGQAVTTRTLEGRGDTETVSFETVLEGEVTDYWAVLDDDTEEGGFVNECREGNNEVLIWRPECP